MMSGLFLDYTAPLYGRANVIMKLAPIKTPFIKEALRLNAIEAIEEHGAFKGCVLSFIRILKCNPLGSSGVDLVKKRKKGVKNE